LLNFDSLILRFTLQCRAFLSKTNNSLRNTEARILSRIRFVNRSVHRIFLPSQFQPPSQLDGRSISSSSSSFQLPEAGSARDGIATTGDTGRICFHLVLRHHGPRESGWCCSAAGSWLAAAFPAFPRHGKNRQDCCRSVTKLKATCGCLLGVYCTRWWEEVNSGGSTQVQRDVLRGGG